MNTAIQTHPSFLTVKQFAQKHPAFKESGIRAWIFYDTNGLVKSGAIVRIGRKVLIDQSLFFDWVQKSGAK